MTNFSGILLAVVTVFISAPLIAQEDANRWAILIGVNGYTNLTDLQFCSNDMHALRDQLVSSGFPEKQVFLLHDKASDRKYLPFRINVEKQLELVLNLANRGDLVVVGFSGHGFHSNGQSWLCPADADLKDPEKTMIALKTVYDALNASQASLKLMMVDACRNDPSPSGQKSARSVKDANRPFSQELQRPPQGILMMTSCAPGEISMEDAEFGNGVFMHFVLEGLKGQADLDKSGGVSLSELWNFTNRQTKIHVARKFNDSQRPGFEGRLTDDFDISRVVASLEPVITNSLGMTLKLIPAGEFMMGSGVSAAEVARRFKDFGAPEESSFSHEHPQHRVRISEPFYLGAHEVTLGEFRKFVYDSGYKTDAESDDDGGWGFNNSTKKFSQDAKYNWRETGFSQTDYHPVGNVSWNDAVAFCRWLSRAEGVEYRLPTEAEWEYACRGGTTSLYQHGDDIEGLAGVANTADGTAKSQFSDWTTITSHDGYVFTSPVGKYRANAFGLYDMHGNVWEWCSDWYGADYYKASPTVDPQGASEGSYRVNRGGSWNNNPRHARSAYRGWFTPGDRYFPLGFRVLRSSVK